MKRTLYFNRSALVRRPYLRLRWVAYALNHPIRIEVQPDGQIRHWAYIAERRKYLRVVTESDGATVHNAFFDRGFKR